VYGELRATLVLQEWAEDVLWVNSLASQVDDVLWVNSRKSRVRARGRWVELWGIGIKFIPHD
jgi:hypothetical protein